MKHFLCAILACIVFILPARGDENESERHRQQEIFEARKDGTIRPLDEILAAIREKTGGNILEVESEITDGRVFYEIYYLDKSGRRHEVLIDAATAKTVGEEEDE